MVYFCHSFIFVLLLFVYLCFVKYYVLLAFLCRLSDHSDGRHKQHQRAGLLPVTTTLDFTRCCHISVCTHSGSAL